MKCDIIIPVWNELEFTASCIESLIRNTDFPFRLIVVDNGSDPATKNYLENLLDKKRAEIELIRNEENLGFVKAVNQGLAISNAPYVCIMNNDTLPGTGWLTKLVEFAEKHPDVGLLNPLCKGHDEQNLAVNEYARLVSANKDKYMEMNQCQGFAMLIKKEVIDKIGSLDENFGLGGFDDTDYSLRANLAGYKSVCVHSAYVYHREHKSFDRLGDRKRIQSEAEKRFFEKWPKPKRLAIIFSISERTEDEEIKNLLEYVLSLARKWYWVNLFIFGDKDTKDRIDIVKEKINLPSHQNIKLNYLRERFKRLKIAVRILERSFGRKRRKKYNMIIYDDKNLEPLLSWLRMWTGISATMRTNLYKRSRT